MAVSFFEVLAPEMQQSSKVWMKYPFRVAIGISY